MSPRSPGAATSLGQIVDSGCCIGCGVCAAVAPGLRMRLDERGLYEPVAADGRPVREVDDDLPALVLEVCPFSGVGPDEDDLAEERFGDVDDHTDVLGRHRRVVAGRALGGHELAGSSGGMAGWLVEELLTTGRVDAVVHVTSTHDPASGTWSRSTVSTTVAELAAGRGSRYHVHTLDEVLDRVRTTPGRYAVVGVPCFVKAVHRLRRVDPVVAERVAVTVALFCGGLRSTAYARYLAWSVGVPPERMLDIDYRHAEPGSPAHEYLVAVTDTDGERHVARTADLPMGTFGAGLFEPEACGVCDDLVGETADVSFGDAWMEG